MSNGGSLVCIVLGAGEGGMERGEQWGQLSLCSFGGRVKGVWRGVSNGGSLVCVVLGGG